MAKAIRDEDGWLHRDTMAILFFLIVQFILGMALNLFVTFPTIPAGSSDQAYLSAVLANPILLAHFIVAIGLLLGSIWLLALAFKSKNNRLLTIGIIGLVSTLTAYLSGIEFLLSSFQNNVFSYTMSMGFIAAILSYFALFHFSAPKR